MVSVGDAMTAVRRLLYIYVDDVYIGALWTAWPVSRALRHAQRMRPEGNAHEVTTEPRWPLDPVGTYRQAFGSRMAREAATEDPGR
jgi:hypothetical protein